MKSFTQLVLVVVVGLVAGCKEKAADNAGALAAAKIGSNTAGSATPMGSGATGVGAIGTGTSGTGAGGTGAGGAVASDEICDSVASHLAGLDANERWLASSVDRKAMANLSPAAYKASVLVSCKRDRWTVEATSCFLGARTATAGEACESKLTADQGTALSNAFTDGLNATAAGSGSGSGSGSATR